MSEYVVEPKSRKQLRSLANVLRSALKLENVLYFPIVELLDFMYVLCPGFSYEIVPDREFPSDVHGDTNILKQHIRLKESVYLGAVSGCGRDRMTIAHEIGHYFTLCYCGFEFQRNFKKAEVPAYQSPEWQAKCFAGELMVNYDIIDLRKSSSEIATICGVSVPAAAYQLKVFREERGIL